MFSSIAPNSKRTSTFNYLAIYDFMRFFLPRLFQIFWPLVIHGVIYEPKILHISRGFTKKRQMKKKEMNFNFTVYGMRYTAIPERVYDMSEISLNEFQPFSCAVFKITFACARSFLK